MGLRSIFILVAGLKPHQHANLFGPIATAKPGVLFRGVLLRRLLLCNQAARSGNDKSGRMVLP